MGTTQLITPSPLHLSPYFRTHDIMSGPYDSYGGGGGGYGGYQQQGGYPPQQGYNQGYPPQQGYDQQYGQQYEQNQSFGPPRRQDSYGPPQHGGFQHGQQGGQPGSYYNSNTQGSNDAYAANQAWMDNNQGAQQGQQG